VLRFKLKRLWDEMEMSGSDNKKDEGIPKPHEYRLLASSKTDQMLSRDSMIVWAGGIRVNTKSMKLGQKTGLANTVAPPLFLMGVLGEIFQQCNGEDWYSAHEVCFVIEVEKMNLYEDFYCFDRYEVQPQTINAVLGAWTTILVEVRRNGGICWSVEVSFWLCSEHKNYVVTAFGGRVGELIFY
jgi:hypothetical protein